MSKVSRFATMLAVALSWTAVSCMGPAYKPPVASTNSADTAAPTATASAQASVPSGVAHPTSSTPILASAGVPAAQPSAGAVPGVAAPAPGVAGASIPTPTTPAAASSAPTAPVAAVSSPWNGSGIFIVGALLGFFCLGTSMYIFRGKPS